MPDDATPAELYEKLLARYPQTWEDTMFGEAPPVVPGSSSEAIQAIAFGDVWARPRLTRRERRMVVLAILALNARADVVNYHLRAAFERGDLDREDFEELVLTISVYGGAPVGAGLMMLGMRELARQEAEASGTPDPT